MRELPKAAGRVLDAVTAKLEVGDSRKIDNSNGAYMPLHVDRLSEKTFSLAHYFQQNGDLVCDPDGVFVKTATGWLPVSLQMCTGHFTQALELDEHDKPTGVRPRALAELLAFSTMWLRNVQQQQGGLDAIKQTISV